VKRKPPELTDDEARKVLDFVIFAEQSCAEHGLGPNAVSSWMCGYLSRVLGDEALIEASADRPVWPLASEK
jgi:hypothetical protein